MAREPKPKKLPEPDKRKYLSQADVPSYTLDLAARVPRAILDEHAGKPTRPLDVAHAMKLQPASGPFRALCGAAIAYGLTSGGPNADQIVVEDLGKRVAKSSGDDAEGLAAKREASLRPRVVREFLQKYDSAKFPREDVALKVLESLGVPSEGLERVYKLILEVATTARFLREINGVQYVDLNHTPVPNHTAEPIPESMDLVTEPMPLRSESEPPKPQPVAADSRDRRVFVTHGRNRDLVPQLKELLDFGQLEPIVSVERQSVSQPVPDKVMADMRLCGAAVIHVDAEKELMSLEGEKEVVLNSNVLIEIGAAMALYGKRFILLVKEGIRLPSNLQGLFEVRYQGDKLDGDATLRLLKTFTELKKLPLERL